VEVDELVDCVVVVGELVELDVVVGVDWVEVVGAAVVDVVAPTG
jgi:hypothetical protein